VVPSSEPSVGTIARDDVAPQERHHHLATLVACSEAEEVLLGTSCLASWTNLKPRYLYCFVELFTTDAWLHFVKKVELHRSSLSIISNYFFLQA